ncbi:phage regulatory protein [Atlantibacter hermannii]|nr:phage regulatory protein [Atlantibacter hermannii]
MGKEHWKVEKQTDSYVAVVRKIIAAFPGGYKEAAEVLDVSQDAIFNRLRAGGDQIFPLEWALVLQRAAGVTCLADYISLETDNGMHIPGATGEDANEEIGIKLAELVGQLGDLVNAYRQYTEDEVVTRAEWKSLNEIAYRFRVTLMTFLNLISRVYCEPERVTPASVQLRAPWRVVISGELTREQFNNTVPPLATHCVAYAWWPRAGSVCYAVNVPGDREVVTHEFAEWAVGDWREEAAAQLCTNLTDGSAITTACPSKLSAGSLKPNALSTCVKTTSMASASVHSTSLSASSGK